MAEPTPTAALTPDDGTTAAPPLDTSTPTADATADQAAATVVVQPGEQLKCPNCGSTDLSQDSNGVWHCAFCRATFRAEDPAMVVVSSPDVQQADRSVIDTADLLTGDQEQRLVAKFAELDRWYGVKLVLETVNTITENVDYYARRRAQELGVGDDATDNGLYILIVGRPHHVQVEAGNGIARYVTHDVIQQVVNGTMIPAFRAGDYVTGVGQGATQLAYQAAAHGSARPAGLGVPGNVAGAPSAKARSGWGRLLVIAIVVGMLVLLGGGILDALGGLVLGGGLGGGSSYDSSYDWGSGSSGGFDSGYDSGGSFGGGDFDSGSSGGGDW